MCYFYDWKYKKYLDLLNAQKSTYNEIILSISLILIVHIILKTLKFYSHLRH